MTSPSPTTADLSTFTGSWVLDPSRTSIAFHTKAMWVLPVKGTAKATEGRGAVGADGTLTGRLVVDVASISTKVKKRDAHLQTADFFDVASYPTITFEATGARPADGGKIEVDGDLTVHGQTRPITLLTEVDISGTSATVTTEVAIDRAAWGIDATPLGAGLHNRVVVHAHFDRA